MALGGFAGVNEPTRLYILRTTGLRAAVAYVALVTAPILAVTTAGSTLWAIHATRTAEDRVQRLLLLVDDKNQILSQLRIGAADALPDENYREFAMRWVADLRSRSSDTVATSERLKGATLVADNGLWPMLQDVWEEARQDGGRNPVDVTAISANLESRKGGDAVVNVWWTQAARSDGRTTKWRARIAVTYAPPRNRLTAQRNLVGLYVKDVSINQEIK
jgi:type IV secretory pathway TrbF-like protein